MKNKVLQTCSNDFKIKAAADGSVEIEGWANKAVIDRGKDLIAKEAWKVENYKKNSIMLFNHDHSQPIGKVLAVEPKDEGLFVKAKISNSKDPMISRIRDLVKEGILNSFSVGIMVDDEDFKDGVNHVKSAELHEISIVSVPMNQESQFSVTVKSLTDSLIDNVEIISEKSGWSDVAKACKILHGHAEVYENFDDIVKAMSEKSGEAAEVCAKFLRMQEPQTPNRIKAWLKKADQIAEGQDVQAVKVPKASFESAEELLAWAEESGWLADDIKEDGDFYVLVQKSPDLFEGDFSEIDMGDGVSAIVGKLKQETNELKDRFLAETSDAISGEEGKNPPQWVSDEELWAKAKRASEQALGEISYAFVVWWYLDQGGSSKKGLLDGNVMTQPITGADNSQTEINPALDQAKQTNVLLSSAVMLLQQLVEKIDSKPKVEVEIEDDQLAKKVESFMMKTTERLSKLGL